MNDPAPPLKIDLRLALETFSAGLAFLLAGIAAVNLVDPYNVLVPLAVGAAIVMINRLLGKSAAEEVASVKQMLQQVIAENNVLRAEATPSVRKAAAEAGAAVNPPKAAEPPAP